MDPEIGEVMFPSTLETLGRNAFYSCDRLTGMDFSNTGVTAIPDYFCYDCAALVEILLPESLTLIGSNSFEYCDALAEVTIPASVTEIKGWAFANNPLLTSVYLAPDSPPALGNGTFDKAHSDCRIYVPVGSVEDYKSSWSAYASMIEPYSSGQ